MAMLLLPLLLLSPLWADAAALPEFQLDKRATTKYMFNFGDSYTDIDFSFSGTKPSAANPIGNPSFPGYTSAGARNYVGYLTANYNNSLLLTYDIAVGGATIDGSIIASPESTKSFADQVTIFQQNAASYQNTAKWTSANTIFTIWFGVNDVNQGFKKVDTTSQMEALFEKDITKYFALIQHLWNEKARKIIILSCPPIHRSPEVLGYSAADKKKELQAEQIFNKKLAAHVKSFQSAHGGTSLNLFDVTASFNTVLNNAAKYGAKDNTCTGGSCLWASALHPGTAIHKQVAADLAAAHPSFWT